jgi:phage N-6-adenine-methyltransferase
MTLVGFRAGNHPQQVGKRGPDDEVDDRGTPADLFAELDAVHRFTLDVAAAPHNAKCAEFYTRADDGLTQPWHGSVWCNPPYSGLSAWLEKAWVEWQDPEGPHRIVLLLPANRPEQPWWQTWVEPYRDRPGSPLTVRFLPGRLRFVRPGANDVGPNERPPFGCCLLTWRQP